MIEIRWVSDYKQLSKLAADIVAETISSQDSVNVALPTGYTPIGMYHELAKRNLNWSNTTVFHLDEYLDLPEGHRGSYKHYMNVHLHWHVDARQAYWPQEHYDTQISNAGGLHLAVLGLGANGHLAFNEPGSTSDSKTRVVELSATTIAQNSVDWVVDTPFPTRAITMGLASILASRSILLIVCGTNKLPILKRALWGAIDSSVPASYLQQHSNVTVLYCD